MNYRLSIEPDAKADDQSLISNAINEFNMNVTGDRNYSPLTIFLRDDDNQIVGGLVGDIWGGWLHINSLWIAEALRKHGYGQQLLAAAETEARAHGCRGIHLETYSFQAPAFYQKLGYTIFGQIDDFPQGHTSYFLRKML